MFRYITALGLTTIFGIFLAWRFYSTPVEKNSKSETVVSSANVASAVKRFYGNLMPIKSLATQVTSEPADALGKVHALLKAAQDGDSNAQYNIVRIMRSCPNYTHKDGSRMSYDETIAAFRIRKEEIGSIHREFERCSSLWDADDVGSAGEWLALATEAKLPQAMALTAEDLLWKTSSDARFRNALPGVNPESVVTDPALDTSLDPRKLLVEAVSSDNPEVYATISHNALLLFPGNPEAHTLYYSWMLVACQQGLDCGKTSELASFSCSRNVGACDNFKDSGDYVLWLASNNNADLGLIETRAAEITAKLDAGQYDDLGF